MEDRNFYCIVDVAKPKKPRLVMSYDVTDIKKHQVAEKFEGQPTELIHALQNILATIAKDSLACTHYGDYQVIAFAMPCEKEEFDMYAKEDYDFLNSVIAVAERKIIPKDNLQQALDWDYKSLDRPCEYV